VVAGAWGAATYHLSPGMPHVRRLIGGLVIGVLAGFLVVFLVVLLKPAFLVNSPRAEHPVILVALVAAPALAGMALAWLSTRQGGD